MTGQNSKQNKRIRVCCESCGKEYHLTPDSIGKKAKCACGRIFVVCDQEKSIPSPQVSKPTHMHAEIDHAVDVKQSSNEKQVKGERQLTCHACGSRNIKVLSRSLLRNRRYRCHACRFRGVALSNPKISEIRHRIWKFVAIPLMLVSFWLLYVFVALIIEKPEERLLPLVLWPLVFWYYHRKSRFYTNKGQSEIARKYREKSRIEEDVGGKRIRSIYDISEATTIPNLTPVEHVWWESERFDFVISEQGLRFAPRQDYLGATDELFIPWGNLSEVVIKGYELRVKGKKFVFRRTLREEFLAAIGAVIPQADKKITYIPVAPPYHTVTFVFGGLSFLPALGIGFSVAAWFCAWHCYRICKSDQSFWAKWGRGLPIRVAGLLALGGFIFNSIVIMLWFSGFWL